MSAETQTDSRPIVAVTGEKSAPVQHIPHGETDDWGPFGHPLFDSPDARALERVGVVDVGSNSVRLVIFDGAARSPAYFYNEKIMCGLGAGLSETGKLNPEGRVRALAALKRFKVLADGLLPEPLTIVATAAVRDATDGQDFCDEVLRETGQKVNVIDGHEEARLSAQGVLLGWPGAQGLICDIGGSSMELAELRDGTIGRCVTSDLGPLKLRDIKGGRRGRKKAIADTVETLCAQMGNKGERLFLVGGSWRAIARIDMHRRGYPMHVMHEYRMTSSDVRATVKYIETNNLDKLRSDCGVSSGRMALVPYAMDVLARVVKEFQPRDIAISSYGIREGLLYEQMPDRLRERDPLVEASRFAEAKDARVPGFGKVLYDFVKPLFGKPPLAKSRLIKAACLLHDVNWRAHPDYRADLCFDTATRANLGGLKHSERVYLGLALMHRYRNKRKGTRYQDVYDLLSEPQQQEAEILGKAMRFGAMLMGSTEKGIGALQWQPRKRVLHVELTGPGAILYSEVAAARLKSLAGALEAAEVRLKIDGKLVKD
ncbi:Guanosine-5'-triphosphate,3'-diphosphate pyrophosphatase [Tritonibacter multivorans]|uniref:Guanosine-5'-triphosphate,3'-diphosphate pyrophosphatase n=1 Tax=Tritonibacter multivorans TaxID=928856 RepID=A0A0P1GGX9_9RHOB|nr:Ppx/GppA family phosphatase [Tritonibacter multivorans]MDA7420702.1 Ppx/GppA family phosphatase [Tritonibacter multivorans]CUH81098.1 Guanosine-5'-triphosphate,3'-diphosphate pyrophosphatase [Tritonibacter multivorans]SFC28188.1 Ppx/GppA phosphatase [Tritonibacter multivorans]